MKITICLLVLLPLAFCASLDGRLEERFLFDVKHFLETHHVLDKLKAALGSDTSEAACEAACPSVVGVIPGASLISGPLCHLACTELQKLAQG